MRPITSNEYTRIQQQAESRMAGMSSVSLYVECNGEGWFEHDFMCDFRISRAESREEIRERGKPQQRFHGARHGDKHQELAGLRRDVLCHYLLYEPRYVFGQERQLRGGFQRGFQPGRHRICPGHAGDRAISL